MKTFIVLFLSILSFTANAGEIFLPPGSSYVVDDTTITCMAAVPGPGSGGTTCYGPPSTCYETLKDAPVSELFIRGSAGMSRCQIRQCTRPSFCGSGYRVFIDGGAVLGDYWNASKDGVVEDLLKHIKNRRCD